MGTCNCCAERDRHDITVEVHARPVEAVQSTLIRESETHIESEGSIASLQTALRTYQARRQFPLNDSTFLDPVDFSIGLEFTEESFADFIGDPEELLTPLVREILRSLPAFAYTRKLKGVRMRSAARLKDGSVYVGEWIDLCRFGKGKWYGVHGDFKEGYWRADVLHYKGRIIQLNGDVYEGDIVNGKKEGRGRYTCREIKSEYEGEWKADKKDGEGVELFSDNGSQYTGSFVEGVKHGKGVLRWSDGSWYEGDFHNDLLEGEGHYVWADHREYKGQWKGSQMHGVGSFVWPDGRVYEGHYERDKKEGFGVYRWEGGKEYEGNWHDGKMHGEGYLLYPGKPKKKYSFVNGKRGNAFEETL